MDTKKYASKEGEKYEDYAFRLYRNRDLYGLKNDVIGFLLNEFKGVDWDESTHRKKITERLKGYDKGYKDAYSEIAKENEEGIKTVVPKTHLDKMSDLIGEYNIRKEEVRTEKRHLKKYMRRATPAVLLAEQYREALLNDELEFDIANDFYLEDLNNTTIKVLLSDWHIALLIDEEYNQYNFEIAKKRLNKFKEEILYLAKVHNANKISITHLGDLIEGYSMRAEQPFDIEFNQSDQITYSQDLLFDFCMDFVNKGYYVDLSAIKGNHDLFRITKTGRNALPDDHVVRTVMKNLKLVQQVMGNDKFKVIENKSNKYDEYVEEINGNVFKYVHGDDESKNDKSKIAKHSSLLGKQVNVLAMGHLHHYRAISRNINQMEIYSGALTGANDYSKKKIKQISNASQTVIVVRDDGTFYPLNIDLQNA